MSDGYRPTASVNQETTFHHGAGLVQVNVAQDGTHAWVTVNHYIFSGGVHIDGVPSFTVHLGSPGDWQGQRAELQRIIDQCEAARAALLEAFEKATDRQEAEAAREAMGPPELFTPAGNSKGLIDLLESGGFRVHELTDEESKALEARTPVFTDETPEEIVATIPVTVDAVQRPKGSFTLTSKCDGNHGGPACPDPECWNRVDEEPARKVPGPDTVEGARRMFAAIDEAEANRLALRCTCPRNHGGRSSTDPTCPLHAGDARD